MTIPAGHLDAVVAYLTEHGEQSYLAIDDGMRLEHPSVHVTEYLLKKLCKEGRVEKKVGGGLYASVLYRAAPPITKAEGGE